MLQAWGADTGNWTEDNIYDAQRILVGLTAAELDNLPLNVDHIYAMGQYDNWDTAQVGIGQLATKCGWYLCYGAVWQLGHSPGWYKTDCLKEICSPYVSQILELITITWF